MNARGRKGIAMKTAAADDFRRKRGSAPNEQFPSVTFERNPVKGKTRLWLEIQAEKKEESTPAAF